MLDLLSLFAMNDDSVCITHGLAWNPPFADNFLYKELVDRGNEFVGPRMVYSKTFLPGTHWHSDWSEAVII